MRYDRRLVTLLIVFISVISAWRSAGATVVVNGGSLLLDLQQDMEYWESPTEEGKQFFGQGISYVQGVRDALWLLSPEGICLPRRTSNLELVSAIVRRLRGSEDLREAAPAVAVVKAIQQEWPCPEAEESQSSAPNNSLERSAGAAAQLKRR